jgi:hypothetical protein
MHTAATEAMMDKRRPASVKLRWTMGTFQAPKRKGRKQHVQSMLVTRKSSRTATPWSARSTSTALVATISC